MARELDPDEDPLVAPGTALSEDPEPLPAFLAIFPSAEHLAEATNWQRTGRGTGLLRAEVALRYARILVQHGVQ